MNRTKVFGGCGLLALLLPSVARAEDATGAVLLGFGLFIFFLLLLGLAVAAVLRFFFKRGNMVWLFAPLPPVAAIIYLMVFSPFLPPPKVIHRGPYVENGGGQTTITVSFGFGKTNLDHLFEKVDSPLFRSELAKYTIEPVSNYTFSIYLEIPSKFKDESEGRHYVGIQVRPDIDMVKAPSMFDAVTYVFSKFVLETDPQPSDTLSKEPTRVPLVKKAN